MWKSDACYATQDHTSISRSQLPVVVNLRRLLRYRRFGCSSGRNLGVYVVTILTVCWEAELEVWSALFVNSIGDSTIILHSKPLVPVAAQLAE